MSDARDAINELIATMYGSGKLSASEADTLSGILDSAYEAEDQYFDLQTDSEEAITYMETVRAEFGRYPFAAPILPVIGGALTVADDEIERDDLDDAGTIATEVLVESVADATEATKQTASFLSNPWVVGAGVVVAASIAIVVVRAEIQTVLRS